MIRKWERDKWKHFFVGIVVGVVLQIPALLFFQRQIIAMAISFSALLIICYGFELFSLVTGKGHYELMDAIAGVLGGVIGILIILIFTGIMQ